MTKFDRFDHVTVLGTGVLGSQIIMQAAFYGKHVVAYDAFPEALEKLPERWEWMRRHYREDMGPAYSERRFNHAIERITTTSDIAEALKDADIVIEAVPEDLDLKRKVWRQVGEHAPEKTLFATNTSSFIPSAFADESGHPEKLVAIHYANMIWKRNIAEIMGNKNSSQEAIDGAIRYAYETGMVVSLIHKEQPGYFLNSLLIPFLNAASKLYVNEIGNPEDIDRNWVLSTESQYGPFDIFDTVGFRVAASIAKTNDDPDVRRFAGLLEQAIEKGYTGRESGRGFYYYDEHGKKLDAVKEWNQFD